MNTKLLSTYFKEINYNTEDDKDGKNYRYHHPLRVLKLAQKLAKLGGVIDKINKDCLFALALFHDIGKNEKLLKKHRLATKDHDINNILLFEKHVYKHIREPKTIKCLAEIVADFSKNEFKFPESRIIKDADNLDEIGILNLWRIGVYAGKHNQDIREAIDYYYNFDRQDKKRKMNKLFLASSKLIAQEKLKEMDESMARLRKANF